MAEMPLAGERDDEFKFLDHVMGPSRALILARRSDKRHKQEGGEGRPYVTACTARPVAMKRREAKRSSL